MSSDDARRKELGMLSQLAARTSAALNVGVTPVEVRDAVHQCAPFVGFPRSLNAIRIVEGS